MSPPVVAVPETTTTTSHSSGHRQDKAEDSLPANYDKIADSESVNSPLLNGAAVKDRDGGVIRKSAGSGGTSPVNGDKGSNGTYVHHYQKLRDGVPPDSGDSGPVNQMTIHENPMDASSGPLLGKGATNETDKLSGACGAARMDTNFVRVQIKEPPPYPGGGGSGGSRRTRLERYLLCCLALLVVACAVFIYLAFVAHRYHGVREICLTHECVKTASSLLHAMDQTADPCEDFFQYACGTWNKRHVIPEDKSSISTFEVLADELQVILKDVLEEPPTFDDNSATLKAKTFYLSCMRVNFTDEDGDKPVRDVMRELGGWPVTETDWAVPETSLEELLGTLRGTYNQGIVVEQWVGPDDKNSSTNIIQLDQITFQPIPSRDYFLKESKEMDAYFKLMVEVAILMGAEPETARTEMEQVLEFETKLANATAPEAERHDTGAIYHKMTLKTLSTLVPQFSWLTYLNTFLPTNVTEEEPVVVYSLPYLEEMGRLLADTEPRILHNYAIWKLVNHMLPFLEGKYLPKRAEFKLVLHGVSAERVKWHRCVDLVNKKMGMAVGALFIKQNFDPKSKETALEMIHNIREAFNELLEENVWMDEETRMVAKEKANAMNERIGYPDLLTNTEELSKEYEALSMSEDLFLENIFNVLKFEASKNLIQLRKPVNKDKWTTEPAVVNAFYNPNKNDIVFPAGILQPLFYSQYFPKSLNYGGIGVVIGHEITHGFDDKGRQFDKDGNMKQWWNNATISRFRDRAQCIIDQYSSYEVEDIAMKVNGKMTQGENIADNGGLKQSYRAYKKWVSKYGEEPLLPGLNLTHDQLFFLNYAQIWCGSMRPEDSLTKIRSSVHSPGPIRVLGPLSNSHDFSKAYGCRPGSRMNPTKKCSVW